MPSISLKSMVEFDRAATSNFEHGQPYWESKCGNYTMARYAADNWRVYTKTGRAVGVGKSRAQAEERANEHASGKVLVTFTGKKPVSDCGQFRLEYKKSNGWRAYKKCEPDAWVVIAPGILYKSRIEAIDACNN